MSTYIQNLVEELVQEHIEDEIYNEDELIRKVNAQLYEIKSEKDKLALISAILERNEIEYQNHLNDCTNRSNCQTEKQHIKVNYFLQQELEELGVVATDNFTWEDKENCNDKLDEILRTIINTNELVDESVQALRNEIEELKTLYVLGKKNWKQQFAGKMSDMVFSGVVSELTAKPIIENVLKPSFEFIAGRLI